VHSSRIKTGEKQGLLICSFVDFSHIPYLPTADNVYYTDPDRANVYLGGGATPRNEQSIAYLLRNNILTNIEALQAEVAYLLKEKKAGNLLEMDDMLEYSSIAKESMKKYLDLVPPGELKMAQDMLANEGPKK